MTDRLGLAEVSSLKALPRTHPDMEAYAPASVTTVFAPPAAGRDRSQGVSVAIRDGVDVRVVPADETRITVDGEPAPFAPVEYLLRDLGVEAAVDVRPAVPLGCGFGASGASTLASALAANEAFGLDRSRDELLAAAHAAEVEAQTGLGDVFVQNRGGIVSSHGSGLTRSESDERIAYTSFGAIPTEDVLGDEETMARIQATGQAALADLPSDPTLAALLPLSWDFARETGLVTDRVRSAVERVEAAGGAATMAMLGEAVVGIGADDVLPNHTRVDTEGAHLR